MIEWKRLNEILKVLVMLTIFVGTREVSAQSYCVKKKDAPVYFGANPKSKLKKRATLFSPYMGTGNQKSVSGQKWVEVEDKDNHKYWFNRKDLSTKFSCLVVIVPTSSLRSGPGSDFALKEPKYAQKNQSFKDLGGEDGWTQIQDPAGRKYWIDLDHIWKAKSKFRISFDDSH